MKLQEYEQHGFTACLEFENIFIDAEIDNDNSVHISSVYLVKEGGEHLDITDYLTPEKVDQAEQCVIEEVSARCDRLQAQAEDAAESRREFLREEG